MTPAQINQVRRFNRTVTQRIGVLDESYLDRGRPLGEARVLFEIGPKGAELRVLREKLGLDSGYMSRLLRALEREGLVRTQAGAADARVRRVTLTAKGKREHAEYDRRSDGFAESLLGPLAPVQRARLVAAMAEVERLMRAAAVTIAVEDAASADAQACLAHYFTDLQARFDAGYDPKKGLPAGADLLNAPHGFFLIARLDGAPIGCVGLKRASADYAEVKRMWVSPDARGLGLGRRLLEELEILARRKRVKRLRLDTNKTLVEARALYAACGYREIPDFNGEPYADFWFEKKLKR